jgi:acyl phosphate:glycerol-3-phosphate acyltransferase
MNAAVKALFVVGAYLLGSVPFGLVLTRIVTGKDVRKVGSGNIGASNVARAAGKAAGVVTLLLDAAKAAVPMLIAHRLFAPEGRGAAEGWTVAVGLAAFAGHCYPVWLRFKGGKGVATALGVFLVLAPIPSLLAVVAYGVAYGTTRISSLGSLSGTAVCCIGTFVQMFLAEGSAAWASPVPWAVLAVTAVIVLRHRANIQRLLKGEERKV